MKNKNISTLIVIALLMPVMALAQKTNIRSAELQLSSGNAEGTLEAKQYIDKAAANELTKNSARMWLVRSEVYTRVVEYGANPLMAGLTDGAGYISAYSMVQFWKSAEKKSYDDIDVAKIETRNAFGVGFNEAEEVVGKKQYDSAVKYYQLLMYLFPQMDTAESAALERKGIGMKYLTNRLATIATYCNDLSVKKEVLTELMDSGSKSPVVYEALSKVYLASGDTAMAEKIVKKAVEVAPGDNTMFQLLVNYYITINRVDLLFDDVNKQLATAPTSKLYYIRGYLYERKDSFDSAIKDYRKAVELDEFNYDGQYNLGVALLKYESRKLYDKKAGAAPSARAAIDEQLKNVYRESRDHLERASENKNYSIDDQINIFKALKTAALELDDKEGAESYQKTIDALEATK